MKECILAVDLGTTNIKGVLYDLDGNQVSFVARPANTKHHGEAKSEQDPEWIFQQVCACISEALANPETHIQCISFSTAVQSFMVVDHAGRPLIKNWIWSDRRARQYADLLTESSFGKRYHELTGNPIYPSLAGCKFQWLKDHGTEVLANGAKIVGIKEYIVFRLTGEWATDYSTASSTGLMDIHTLKWSLEALDYFEISEEQLPELEDVTCRIPLRKGRHHPLNVPYELPIILGASDGCLANLGVGAISPGKAAITIGTSGAVRVAANKPYIDPKQRLFCYYLFKGSYIIGGAANTGASTYHWFLDTLDRGTDPNEIARSFEDFESWREPPIFLPYLQGERAPIWSASASAGFYGITSRHDLVDFRLAVVHGILYAMRNIADTIEENELPIESLAASGGFLDSEVILQMLADSSGRKVVHSGSSGSAFGAFLLAMLSLKNIPKFKDAENLITRGDTFEPRPDQARKHQAAYQTFLKLQKTMMEL